MPPKVDVMDQVQQTLKEQQSNISQLMETQQKAFQASFEAFMVATNKRNDDIIGDFSSKISDLKHSLEFTQGGVDDLHTSIDALKKVQHENTDQLNHLYDNCKAQ